ncbi:MAG: DUF4340 domain-containing protein [Clostridia bacterium]|nr:DUF4340 domain-containing protein [Clostridia bacterium]
MKRMKKMLLLLIALVLCIGGYYGVQLLSNETASVTEETGTFALDSHAAGDLTGLAWTQGDESFAFTLTDGVWSVTTDPAFPLNQEDVQAMANDLLALVGTRQLDGVADLSAYGLSEPSFSVTVSWSDGTSTTYTMGDETPFGDGYYLSLDHEGILYTVTDDIADIFDTTMNDLAVLETIPTTTSVTHLTVGSTLDIVKEETSRTINEGELWYDSLTGSALDAAAAEALIADAQAIAWAELSEPTASDEELTTYNLDEASATAITLYEDETAMVTLLIGAQNDAGDYYARLPGSTMVYTVAGSDVSSLLTASSESMPSMTIIDVAAENIQSAAFTAGEASYVWQPAAAETSDTATDEVGESLWASILALEAESRLSDAAAGTILLAVEVTDANGGSAVLTFTEHDAQSYAVSVLERVFLVDAAEVDAIIRTLRANAK